MENFIELTDFFTGEVQIVNRYAIANISKIGSSEFLEEFGLDWRNAPVGTTFIIMTGGTTIIVKENIEEVKALLAKKK